MDRLTKFDKTFFDFLTTLVQVLAENEITYNWEERVARASALISQNLNPCLLIK